MSPWTALKEGSARIWFHKRLLLWLYLVNLLFATVLVVPFREVVSELGKTDLADKFVSGFPLDTFIVFWSQQSTAFKSLGIAAVGLGTIYLLVNIFLSGGIIATLTAKHRVSMRRFLNTAGRYFLRYLRLFVILVIVIGLLAAGYGMGLSDIVDRRQENALTDVSSFFWRAGPLFALLVIVSLILMVFDYAKIRTIVDGRRSMFFASLAALKFALRRGLRTASLFYLNLLLVLVLWALYLAVESQFSNATLFSMISLFMVQQLFILSRVWMRLSFFSSQLAFYQAVGGASPSPLQARPGPVEKPARAPAPPGDTPANM